MRLFHVSEDGGIRVFHPRPPERNDLDKSVGLVWAVDENRLPNFLTPRNCPRVTYHVGVNTTEQDKGAFFTSPDCIHAVVIESRWFEAMKKTRLFLYEFDPINFALQDAVAGYYTSESAQAPIGRHRIDDLFEALFERNVELRVVRNLWYLSDKIKETTLNWSLCRMGYAQPREQPSQSDITA
ncbi:MAG: DUF6886 family protein [Clostridiaceae bacterium]|nr:hypothetical protein [Eubacteriales bacterium]